MWALSAAVGPLPLGRLFPCVLRARATQSAARDARALPSGTAGIIGKLAWVGQRETALSCPTRRCSRSIFRRRRVIPGRALSPSPVAENTRCRGAHPLHEPSHSAHEHSLVLKTIPALRAKFRILTPDIYLVRNKKRARCTGPYSVVRYG